MTSVFSFCVLRITRRQLPPDKFQCDIHLGKIENLGFLDGALDSSRLNYLGINRE